MSSERNRFDELRASLSGLLARDASSKEELRDWYLDARCVLESLTEPGGLGPAIPEMIWHYLADADMRSKDPTYRDQQEAFLRAFLALMKTGEVPSEAAVLAFLKEAKAR
jgi:hypothetical protein